MRDDNTEPRDNQQIADDNQQSEIDITQREAETISNRAPEEEPDSPYHVPPRGDRAGDVPED
jgi:hypothetical protein